MTSSRGRLFLWALAGMVLLALVLVAGTAYTQQAQTGVEVIPEVKHDVSPPLRDIPPKPRHSGPPEEHEIRLLHPPRPIQHVPDSALQTFALPRVATTAGLNFDGVSANGSAPPDTNGSAGQTQFVQWVNTEFEVWDKNGNHLMGPTPGNTIWSGFGGPCQKNNDGDPIAQYDKLNNRWIMSQFSVSSAPPFYQCVAVSTTDDATGTFNRYAFQESGFNDYPKIGVWPDAYYATYNNFGPNGSNFVGALLCAMDGAEMRAGNTATQQCFQLNPNFGGVLPGDVDGATPPPAGETESFVNFGTNSLNLWEMHVDFSNSSNTTLTGPTSLSVNAFSEACGGGTCIPQTGTTQQLDSLADRVMYRLAYRNFGSHESLVVNHSVTAGSSVGVRWYEIQNPASAPTVAQQSTFAPDSNYRWMGSIAMDQAGDIALGYSVSSSSAHPAISYTGRISTDPADTMESEASIFQGNGSQNGGLSRWGDYSSMSVDPVEDCTFWYTTEYIPSNGSFNWNTRIASFKFNNCTGGAIPAFSITTSPGSATVGQGSTANYTIAIAGFNGFSDTVNLTMGSLPAGVTPNFNPSSLSAGQTSTLSLATTGSTPAGTYPITIVASTASLTHTAEVNLVVKAPDFTISASPSSRTVTQGNGTSYTVTIGALNGFTGTVGFSTTGLPSGAGATFSPTTVTTSGNSTMNVTTSTTTPTGTYTITITGTSGSLHHSASVRLVVNSVNPPDFSISASPSSQTVGHPGSTSYTVTVTALNGFTGTVSFSVSGLPSNTTAKFNPTSVTGSGTSKLTITTTKRTKTGTFTLTIKGTSGSLSHTTTVGLTVH
jgi:hypothetical protein